jgi:hypothetical protein
MQGQVNHAVQQFCVERCKKLPPLAWLLDIDGEQAKLVCGHSVVVAADGFFEGAWAGAFEAWDFARCCEVFGSGCQLTHEGWMIVPPSHTLECVYLLQRSNGTGFLASNSLAFLFARSGAGFIVPSWRLSPAFIGVVEGLDRTPVRLDTTVGTLWLVHHHNVLVGAAGPSARPKPLPAPFGSYSDYSGYLHRVLAETAVNARAEGRCHSYQPLATISSGYDSPACAAIAHSVGCRSAVTFTTEQHGKPDDGSEIGRAMGLDVIGVRRPRGAEEFDELTVAEFFSPGMHGDDLVSAAFADILPHCLLVTGFHGDKIWDIHNKPSDKIVRGDISGSSLGEFRLARDFVHVPLPFVGARRHADIARISNAEEMRPYSVGGRYDRPIPRRIAEQAGAPRTSFGQSKKAVAILPYKQRGAVGSLVRRQAISAIHSLSLRDRLEYMAGVVRFRFAMAVHALMWMGRRLMPETHLDRYDAIRGRVQRAVMRYPYAVFEHTDPFMGVVFDWGRTRVMRRYQPDTDPNARVR